MSFESLLVSAAAAKIYARPGSLTEHRAHLMEPGSAEAVGIRFVFDLYSAAYYRRPAGNDIIVECSNFTNGLIEHFNAERHCHASASVVVIVSDAVVHHNIIYARHSSGYKILYETYRPNDRVACRLSEAAADESLAVSPFYDPNQQYLYIGSAGSFNYGHWLVDDLPRAKAWLHLKSQGIVPIILLPSYGDRMNAVRAESLRSLIDSDVRVQFIDPDQPHRIPNLYYATPVSFHPRVKSPGAIDFVRKRATKFIGDGCRDVSRRLFVARSGSDTRRMMNLEEVSEFMKSRSFELIDPNGMTFEQQIRTFSEAEFVVGQMGAAMTNTIFCRNGVNNIYLAPGGWTEPFYYDLAIVTGQQYHVHFGPALAAGKPALANFNLPLGELHHRLKYMGVEPTAG